MAVAESRRRYKISKNSILLILRTAWVDNFLFNSTMLARMFSAGVLVVRGKDWQWGNQGSGSIGNITQGLGVYSTLGWIEVLWADGQQNAYRVGDSGKYDGVYSVPGYIQVLWADCNGSYFKK